MSVFLANEFQRTASVTVVNPWITASSEQLWQKPQMAQTAVALARQSPYGLVPGTDYIMLHAGETIRVQVHVTADIPRGLIVTCDKLQDANVEVVSKMLHGETHLHVLLRNHNQHAPVVIPVAAEIAYVV